MKPTRDFEEYDPAWPDEFEIERVALKKALGDAAVSVEHVGSTAIPGMPGKGIIDILVTVRSLQPTSSYEMPLTAMGYVSRPVPDRPTSPFFTKPSEKPRTHNVHIALGGSSREKSLLAFRDYLRTHPVAAAEYESVKRELVRLHPSDWDRYSGGKQSVATTLAELANNWAASKSE